MSGRTSLPTDQASPSRCLESRRVAGLAPTPHHYPASHAQPPGENASCG
jgi:hypothetical protein